MRAHFGARIDEQLGGRIIDDLTRRFEESCIRTGLAHTGGRKVEAAHLLGWGRNTLTRKIAELNLDV